METRTPPAMLGSRPIETNSPVPMAKPPIARAKMASVGVPAGPGRGGRQVGRGAGHVSLQRPDGARCSRTALVVPGPFSSCQAAEVALGEALDALQCRGLRAPP